MHPEIATFCATHRLPPAAAGELDALIARIVTEACERIDALAALRGAAAAHRAGS